MGEGGCAPSNEAHSYNIYLIFHACTAPHSFNFVTNIFMRVVPCDPFTDIAIEITHLIIFAPSHFRAVSSKRLHTKAEHLQQEQGERGRYYYRNYSCHRLHINALKISIKSAKKRQEDIAYNHFSHSSPFSKEIVFRKYAFSVRLGIVRCMNVSLTGILCILIVAYFSTHLYM